MPELPEVETVRRDMHEHLLGCKILDIEIKNDACIKCPDTATFIAALKGKTFTDTGREGKYLRLFLDDESTLTVHLRMTGRIIYTPSATPHREHTHIIFKLSDGAELRYSDTRRFGCLWLQQKDEEDCTGAQNLGLEPLDESFCAEYLIKTLGKRKMPVKSAILDQRAVAGLGNIYADEVLFISGISPTRPANEISSAEWQHLAENMRSVLLDAIENRGTTFSDFLDGEGKIGSNQHFLRVYGKKHQPCPTCNTELQYQKVGGRGTVHCPNCQK